MPPLPLCPSRLSPFLSFAPKREDADGRGVTSRHGVVVAARPSARRASPVHARPNRIRLGVSRLSGPPARVVLHADRASEAGFLAAPSTSSQARLGFLKSTGRGNHGVQRPLHAYPHTTDMQTQLADGDKCHKESYGYVRFLGRTCILPFHPDRVVSRFSSTAQQRGKPKPSRSLLRYYVGYIVYLCNFKASKFCAGSSRLHWPVSWSDPPRCPTREPQSPLPRRQIVAMQHANILPAAPRSPMCGIQAPPPNADTMPHPRSAL